MFKHGLITFSIIWLFSGCNSSNNESEIESEFNTAKARWEQQNVSDYQITTQRSCFCIPRDRVVNIVEQNQLSGAFFVGNGQNLTAEELAYQKTIDDYFGLIEQAIDDQAFSLIVSYHTTLGYPTQISIGYDQLIADGGISYRLTDFRANIIDIEQPQLDAQLILKDQFDQPADSFVQGEEITFFLSVTNNGSGDALLNFSNSQQFDFYIQSSIGSESWRWSDDRAFTTALTELQITVGETIEISQVWDQELSVGENIPVGSYTAFGSLLDHTSKVESDLIIQ